MLSFLSVTVYLETNCDKKEHLQLIYFYGVKEKRNRNSEHLFLRTSQKLLFIINTCYIEKVCFYCTFKY